MRRLGPVFRKFYGKGFGKSGRRAYSYTDYDGESLHIWRDSAGELWVDKTGEGPVYVRSQDIELIVMALTDEQRVPDS